MIVRIIHVYVTEDSPEAFRKATEANHVASVNEPGVLRFDVLMSSEDPLHFVLYEAYRSEAATEAHKATDHYERWRKEVEPMMSHPRERTEYSVVAPLDPAAW